mmetsp:Transcript_58107/g.136227  ORF Transcript_58107/g.136227 Transcript_58107/m.136227 type:complete len:256 (+) Transcript_58107:43-810(+)
MANPEAGFFEPGSDAIDDLDKGSKVSAAVPSVITAVSVDGSKVPSALLSKVASLPALAVPEADEAQRARTQEALRRLNAGWKSTYASMCHDVHQPGKEPSQGRDPGSGGVLPWEKWDSEYRNNFVDHHSPPPARPVPKKQYIKTPAELQREHAAKDKHRKLIEEARAKERRRLDGKRSELHTGPLTAPLKPPNSEVHYNYVGGPPPSLWRSDYRANLQPYVHSTTANARMAQPTPLAVVSSPISLFPGVVGHPDM